LNRLAKMGIPVNQSKRQEGGLKVPVAAPGPFVTPFAVTRRKYRDPVNPRRLSELTGHTFVDEQMQLLRKRLAIRRRRWHLASTVLAYPALWDWQCCRLLAHTVGKSKTAAGTGRLIPLNPRALAVLTHWRGLFPGAQAHHYVFPHEKYGLAGNERQPCAWEIDPAQPMQRWKVAWESARKAAGVSCRFHDLRHTFISRLAESQASDSTIMALAGHVSRAMMERYSHIRMEAKRRAVDTLSGTDFEPAVAQNWAQFLG